MIKLSIIDVHSHIQFPVYDGDRREVVRRAKEAGVKMIAVGTQASTSEAAIKLAREYTEDIWATVGFHPNHVVIRSDRSVGATNLWYHDTKEQKGAAPEKFDIERLRNLAKDPKVVAIGECGLDYYRLTTDDKQQTTTKKLQKDVFLQQVELAQELKKPLMIHCRPSKGTDDAYEDLLTIIPNSQFLIPQIIHFYVGSLEITKKLAAAGFYFTFGGVVTFVPRPKAGTPVADSDLGARGPYDEIVKYIPLDRILLETDCPYVAPLPYRGKRNEPAYILETAKKLAELKNLSYEEIADWTTKNTLKIFQIVVK